MTPIGRLVREVLDRHPSWTQSSIAARAGIERSVLNAYMHKAGRAMAQPTREALAKAMRIEQWEIDEAAAEQAGFTIRRPDLTVDAHKLLSRAEDLSADQTARWYRLARALADALATEDERDLNAQSENSGDNAIATQNVAIDRSIASHGEQIVAAGPDGSTPPTPAEREYADTVSDAALERMRRRHTGE